MDYQLIVAKYKEHVDWIQSVPSRWNVTVYAKDPNELDEHFIKLPNLGREAHTYLHHILLNYDTLAEITVFAQGNPFDHSPDFLRRLESIPTNITYFPLSNQEILLDELGNPHLTGNPPTSYGMNFKQFFEHITGKPCPILMYCFANAIFAVSRVQILSHPKEFYERCMESFTCLETPTSTRVDQNIMEAHYFERIWHVIFYPGGSLVVPREKLDLLESLITQYKEARNKDDSTTAMNLLHSMNARIANIGKK